jgi:hypothetical protein
MQTCDNCIFQDINSHFWKCDDTRPHEYQSEMKCENWEARTPDIQE